MRSNSLATLTHFFYLIRVVGFGWVLGFGCLSFGFLVLVGL